MDYLNDAVKEFGIRAKDGTSDEAFKQLGLDVDDLKTKFAQRRRGGKEAFKTVNEALFSCDDEGTKKPFGRGNVRDQVGRFGRGRHTCLSGHTREISATNDALGTINENKYNDLGNQIEELGRNNKTDLGKPIGEELKPVISDVIKEVKGKIPEVKTLVLAVVSKVKDFISFMSRNGTQIISIIAGIAAGMLAWNVVTMIQGLVAAIKVWKATTEGRNHSTEEF